MIFPSCEDDNLHVIFLLSYEYEKKLSEGFFLGV